MTPEQEKVLYDVLERVTSVDVKLDGMSVRLTKHESDDAEYHEAHGARIGKVEKKQTQLGAYYAAACVVAPIIWWWLSKGAAAQ